MNPLKAISFTAIEKVLRLIGNIAFLAVSARNLEPEELGVFAIIFSIYQILRVFIGGSLVNAFLKSDHTNEIRDKLFSFSIIFSLMGFLLFIVIRPLIENVFDVTFTHPTYLLMSMVLFLLPINLFSRGILQEKRSFDKIAISEIIVFYISIIIGITILLTSPSILALAVKFFAESMLILLVYRYLLGIAPKLNLTYINRKDIHLLRFALGLSSSRFLTELSNNGTNLFVGYFYPIKFMAFFSYSKNLALIPETFLRTTISGPMMVYLSKYSGKESFQKFQTIASSLLFVSMMPASLLVLKGDQLLVLLMGTKWAEFGLMFQILGIFGMAQVLKGWLTVVYTNNMHMRDWNKFVFLELFLILLLMGICSSLGLSIFGFIVGISLFEVVFWSIIYATTNFKFITEKNNWKQYLLNYQLFICPLLILVIVHPVLVYFIDINLTLSVLLGGTLASGIVFIYLAICNRSVFASFLKLIQSQTD